MGEKDGAAYGWAGSSSTLRRRCDGILLQLAPSPLVPKNDGVPIQGPVIMGAVSKRLQSFYPCIT